MKKVVVNDTNVFIDLQDIGLLEQFFRLPWEINTTDFVMLELLRDNQKEAVAAYESDGSLHIVKFEANEIIEISKLHRNSTPITNVSFTNCSVWFYAKRNNCILLTGDQKLRTSALHDGVEVHGTIYIFDELVACGILPEHLAAEKLTILKSINPRLPKNEIEKRIKLWDGSKSKEGGCL